MTAYDIIETDVVKKALDLNSSPVGLQIEKEERKDACIVSCVPPADGPHMVSDSLLDEWVEDKVIEKK